MHSITFMELFPSKFNVRVLKLKILENIKEFLSLCKKEIIKCELEIMFVKEKIALNDRVSAVSLI